MKEMLRYALVLGVICVAASALLAGVHQTTKGRIEAQLEQEYQASLKQLMPDAAYFDETSEPGGVSYYRALDKDKKFIGVVFGATAKGYSSAIETLAAMDIKGNIKAIKIVNQGETPGLGSRVAEPDFTGQFASKSVSQLRDVQAITGATISSRAVIDSVETAARKVSQELDKDGKKSP